ncbi:MAG TPA: hypothetical protein VFF57_03405 [Hanamia sp.]|nr:hypothetical protein [Hanamia sp.]
MTANKSLYPKGIKTETPVSAFKSRAAVTPKYLILLPSSEDKKEKEVKENKKYKNHGVHRGSSVV